MNKVLTSLLVVAALSSAVVLAKEPVRPTTENGARRVATSQHGKTSCVLVDEKIFCAPATTRPQVKLAAASTN
jgi:hypothetical protein